MSPTEGRETVGERVSERVSRIAQTRSRSEKVSLIRSREEAS